MLMPWRFLPSVPTAGTHRRHADEACEAFAISQPSSCAWPPWMLSVPEETPASDPRPISSETEEPIPPPFFPSILATICPWMSQGWLVGHDSVGGIHHETTWESSHTPRTCGATDACPRWIPGACGHIDTCI